jgi:hypothetical protein
VFVAGEGKTRLFGKCRSIAARRRAGLQGTSEVTLLDGVLCDRRKHLRRPARPAQAFLKLGPVLRLRRPLARFRREGFGGRPPALRMGGPRAGRLAPSILQRCDLLIEPSEVLFPLHLIRKLRDQSCDDQATGGKRLARFRRMLRLPIDISKFRIGHRQVALPAGVAGVGLGQMVSDRRAPRLTAAVALCSRIYVKLGKVGWIISFAVFVQDHDILEALAHHFDSPIARLNGSIAASGGGSGRI